MLAMCVVKEEESDSSPNAECVGEVFANQFG